MSATDKDWDAIFDLFCTVSYDFAHDVSSTAKKGCDNNTEKQARVALLRSEHDEQDKKGFLFSVYGFKGVLPREDFVKVVQQPQNIWILSGDKLRARLAYFRNEKLLNELEEEGALPG